MKKSFLPFSLLLVIMFLGQSVMADQVGHYLPRVKETTSPNAYLSSLRVNQHTGLIDPALMIAAAKEAANANTDRDDLVYWLSMGPDNMGGRTTSIVYNNANRNEVYIGSMGGGVFYTWNLGTTWHQVGRDLMVSCLAQTDDGTIYVGTGDCFAAATTNGMSDLGYDHGFIGSGLYAIKNNEMTFVASTEVNATNGWAYINDLAILNGNTIVAATDGGLRYSSDRGATWTFAKDADGADITGNTTAVKVAKDNDVVVAAVEGMLYMGASLNSMACYSTAAEGFNDNNEMVTIATAAGLLDVAIAPSNSAVVYASAVAATGNHSKIYATENGGQTWRVILPSVNATFGHQVYEGKGLFNHGLEVDPMDEDVFYVTGLNLWRLVRPTNDPNGYYLTTKLSDGAGTSFNMYDPSYLHAGVNKIAFDPRDDKKAYIATDGGIYKSQATSGSEYFTYENCNRGYVAARCFNVAPSVKSTRVIAGTVDHGPIFIEGQEGTNHLQTAVSLYPYNNPNYYGIYEDSYAAGFCAASTIAPNTFIVTTTSGDIKRTETAGADYDVSNFLANDGDDFTSDAFSFSGFRMPIALWETYDDEYLLDTVWYKSKDTIPTPAHTKVLCFSKNAEYPFEYSLPYTLPAGDSIQVLDPIGAYFFVAEGSALYMTREALRFNIAPYWHKLTTLASMPTCIAVSNDGTMVYVGMNNGNLVRVMNPINACDYDTLSVIDVTEITLPTEGQCVTSVSISNDGNGVVVTLGNYGNNDYVLYSANAAAAEPTFTSKQGNLAKMPVYSSVIDMTTGDVLIGTEHGVYRSKSIASTPNWALVSDNMGDVPVMELKQQTVYHETIMVPTFVNDGIVDVPYAGPNNQGMIYAATYGKGLFRCETYRLNSGDNVNETPVAASEMKLFPNPVRSEATISFELSEGANVTYQVFDMSGRVVRMETLGHLSQGNHETQVSVEGLAQGAYVLRLNAGKNTQTTKFMVF